MARIPSTQERLETVVQRHTTEPHLKAYTEAGLHDFTHGFVSEMSSNGSEEKSPQDLKEEQSIKST